MKRRPNSNPPAHLLPVRVARMHGRLLVSIAFGVAVALAPMTADWRVPAKLLTAWDCGVVLYLALTYWMMAHSDVAKIKRRASDDDEGAVALLILSAVASMVSLAAIVAELANSKDAAGAEAALHVALGMSTIVLSWSFVHTIFTLHYAHEYYGERGDSKIGGLAFPGRGEPDYWDFLYFALVIAMTSQVSDVAVSSRVMRHVVTIHGVLSFFFNLAILALTFNMVSNLI